MAEQSRRQQLKKNELEDVVVRIAEWIKNNRSAFYTGAGIVAGMIAFSVFFLVRYQSLASRGEERLSVAQSQAYQGQSDQAIASLDAIIGQYSGGVAVRARMMKADILASRKQYKDARDTLNAAIEKGKPERIIPLAMAELGNIEESAEEYQAAAGTYSGFLARFPEHFLAARVYESLARVYALSGNVSEAKNTNEKIITLFPSSVWAQRAQERLSPPLR